MCLCFARDGYFTALLFDHKPTLDEMVKEMGWGNNHDIHQHGFRIDSNFKEEIPYFSKKVEDLPIFKEHRTILDDDVAVMPLNGETPVIVRTMADKFRRYI